MDRISPDQRSRLMARVRERDTGIEVSLRKEIWGQGFRYRKNHRVEGVKVDLAFLGNRLVVFVDGCFWHGCPAHYSVPKSSVEFWAGKIRANVDRDRRQTANLEEGGWRVVRVWEHAVKSNPEGVADEIIRLLVSGRKPKGVKDWRVVEVKRVSNSSETWILEDLRDGASKTVQVKVTGAK